MNKKINIDIDKVVDEHWNDCKLFSESYKNDARICIRKALMLYEKQANPKNLLITFLNWQARHPLATPETSQWQADEFLKTSNY